MLLWNSLKLILVLLTLFIAGCGGTSAPPVAVNVPWIKFESPDGNFDIRFPSEPFQKQTAISGGRRRHVLHVPMHEGRLIYSLQYMDGPPPANFETALLKAQETLLNTVQGTLQQEAAIPVDGFPGRSVSFTFDSQGQPRRTLARLVAASGRVYSLTVTGSPDLIKESDVERFFNSFAVTGGTEP